MAFKLTKKDLLRSRKCPPGMHLGALSEVADEYLKENGISVIPCTFETDSGYSVNVWFNSKVMDNLFEFIAAADKIKFDVDTFDDFEVSDNVLKQYIGKKVAFSVSHRQDDNGKIQSQIDAFYNSDAVPF